jgi:chromosome condensin MukBEF MukE localization factor
MVQQCVLNWICDYWLLLDTSISTMAILVNLQGKYRHITIITLHLKCNDFDNELEIMYARIYVEVVQMLIPILDFFFYFQSWKNSQYVSHNARPLI